MTPPSSPSVPCPHCDSTDTKLTKPGCLADILFFVSILFMMSGLKKGRYFHCNSCGKDFRA